MSGVALRALTAALAAAGALGTGSVPAGAVTGDGGKPFLDVRDREAGRSAAPADPGAARARERLEDRLGPRGVVRIDPRTGTARLIARPGGALTGPSAADPTEIALAYVRANRPVFRLSDDDVAGLRPVRRYSDGAGVTYLVWAQTARGLTAFGGGLHAAVAADGRLLTVSGSPVPGLAGAPAAPRLSAGAALSVALGDAGKRGAAPRAQPRGGADQHTVFSGGHEARLVLFPDRPGDVRLAWRVTAHADADEVYEDVVDATSGDLLYRSNQVRGADASVRAFTYAPGLGPQDPRTTLVSGATLRADSGTALRGPYADVYADADANDVPDPDAAFPATSGTTWDDPFADKCADSFVCSWNDAVAFSWRDNLRQNAAQAYFLVNNFHDWMENEPGIAWTRAAGNFDWADGDGVRTEIVDGAATDAGLPGSGKLNNANMQTPADGRPPRMQLFLYADRAPPVTRPDGNAGDDASVVYHEYTHGLSARTVTDSSGSSALDADQASAMGEAWSDWYALDYLVARGLQADTATDGEVQLGRYLSGDDPRYMRTKPIDCRIGSTAPRCSGRASGGSAAGADAYTYGDFAKIASGAQEHTDGEIWSQTLWDMRRHPQIGPAQARRLITTGMRLAPPEPSMVDMRDAILLAESDPTRRAALWSVFAARGLGYFAFSEDGNDNAPRESFAPPPPPGTGGAVRGRVTDRDSGAPVAGALVEFTGIPGDLTAVTDAGGNYAIPDVPAGTFPRLTFAAAGHDPEQRSSVEVPAGGTTIDQTLRRDHAALASGARLADATSPDGAPPGCGPEAAIDLNLGTGWSSAAHNAPSGPQGPKEITIALARPVDVKAFGIDPSAKCGHGDSASTGGWRIETSPDGQAFTEAAGGTFTPANNHRLNEVEAVGGRESVRFVRFVTLSPQRGSGTPADGSQGSVSGRDFMDVTEVEVYGTATNVPPPAAAPAAGEEPPAALAPPDLTAPVAKLSLVRGQRLRGALAKGLKVVVRCSEPCRGKLAATLDAKTAKRLKLLPPRSRAKSVKVASGSVRAPLGLRTVTVRFTRAARTRLRRERTVGLLITASAADGAGNGAKRSLKAVLRR